MDEQALGPGDARVSGAKLRQAREDRGWTQDQVAQKLGVARTTIVAIEKGDRRVKPQELVELARLYGRRISGLLQQTEVVEDFSVQLRGSLPSPMQKEEDLMSSIREFQSLAEDYVSLEARRRAPLSKRYPPVYEIEGVEAQQAAEDVAVQERSRLGLGDGPVLNLRDVLEGTVGMRVFLLRMPSSVSGMYSYSESLGGCIAVNLAHPPGRRRQSMAHEYGHFLTCRFRPEVMRESQYERKPQSEWFAEAFGRAFLIPAEGVRRRFLSLQRERHGGITRGDLCRLAHSFAVSVEAMVRRLEEIRLVSSGLWERLRSEGFKVREALRILGLDSPVHQDQILPVRFVSLALEAWQEGELSEGQVAAILRVSRLAARELLLAATSAGDQDEEPLDLGAPLPVASGEFAR